MGGGLPTQRAVFGTLRENQVGISDRKAVRRMAGIGKGGERGPLPLKAKIGIGVGCALVAIGIGAGIAVASQTPMPIAGEAAQPTAAGQPAESQKQKAVIEVDLGEWDAVSSTPLIAHITGDGVDLYTALDGEGKARIELLPGDYTVEFVPSIGADGSLLKVSGKQKLSVNDSGGDAYAVAAKADAADVSKEEISAVMEQIAEAVKNGDSSLKGEAGKKLLETAKAGAAANPNMDDEAKADAEAKAAEGEAAADQPAKDEGVASSGGSSASAAQSATASGSNSGGSNSGGSSSGLSSSASSAPSQPAHTHNWVAVTSQQWHSNPVSVWVQDSAAWDEPIYESVTICNCGEISPSRDHLYNHMVNGERANTTVKRIQTGTIHHEATGHYETQDQGWYETVTTGYQCSGCGAWQ